MEQQISHNTSVMTLLQAVTILVGGATKKITLGPLSLVCFVLADCLYICIIHVKQQISQNMSVMTLLRAVTILVGGATKKITLGPK